jgi:3-phenylpropionate/trans-cinnamate dioxygenase ferredoxin subunit
MLSRLFWRRGAPALDTDFVPVCAFGEVTEGEIRPVPGLQALLCRVGETLYAVESACPHAGALLEKGRLVEGCLECPLHGARFALERGTIRRGPARRGLATHEVLVENGQVYVAIRPRHRRGWWSR